MVYQESSQKLSKFKADIKSLQKRYHHLDQMFAKTLNLIYLSGEKKLIQEIQDIMEEENNSSKRESIEENS